MLKAILVDDEALAREELAEQLALLGECEVVAEFPNAIECLKHIRQLQVDVMFVDVQMPQVTGLELVNMLDEQERPLVVFVTAYDQYAIQAFEDNAFDYLLKPVEPKRLAKTVKRLSQALATRQVQAVPHQSLKLIPCYYQNRIKLIQLQDVEYAFSDQSGVHINTANTQLHSQLSLKVLEEKTSMLRCHRQYLVHPQAIAEIEIMDNGSASLHTRNGAELPVSRRFMKGFLDMFKL
ncbi:two-component system response regulator BtsR [Gynuella sunshinyii]|uniref:Response regulator of the LytR/AlgR family n=1 Tax=Gynuella sunshinyii YC6258 TaxID=1445510 RepID=A0A0C5VHG2_9GAMM|nr:two-component system response regulator BtsR [Gynuella sunshinyii]AJQ94112.1 response regulator of the LytR/AlgR family [Gynuella sunshinyii YC6258]